TSHPSSHHDKDNNARARSGKCFPVDSLDFVDNHDDSIYLHKNAESNCQGLQTINSLLKSAGFEASQVEVEFVGRWISLFPQEMIEYALNKSVLNGKKNLYYVEAIIDSWLEKGIRTLEEARKETRYDNYVKFVKPFG
ncbi:MAG: DnaD domain protein, partial [Actinobacteria bacterium]|nr:DnaD domain protein [Actinomycetota bacterium]